MSTSKSAAESCRSWLKRTSRNGLVSLTLAVTPVPASRPRVSKWGTYYGKNYTRFRKEAAAVLAEAVDQPTDDPLVVVLEHVVTKPKTGKLANPKGDVDNYAKGSLDVITTAQKAWADDDQIVGLCVFKRYAEAGEKPAIHVSWASLEDIK